LHGKMQTAKKGTFVRSWAYVIETFLARRADALGSPLASGVYHVEDSA